ncbi:MAG: E3 binding domain-containing protein [Deinococcaceae bacterium]
MEPTILPSAKKLAEENGLNWRKIRGTGPDGEIGDADVLDYLMRVMSGEEELPEGSVDPVPETLTEDMAAMQNMIAGSGMADANEMQQLMSTPETQTPQPSPEPDEAESAVEAQDHLGDDDLLDINDFELDDDPLAASAATPPSTQDSPSVVLMTDGEDIGLLETESMESASVATTPPDIEEDFAAFSGNPFEIAETVESEPMEQAQSPESVPPVGDLDEDFAPSAVSQGNADIGIGVSEVSEATEEMPIVPEGFSSPVAMIEPEPRVQLSDISLRLNFDPSELMKAQEHLQPLLDNISLTTFLAKAAHMHRAILDAHTVLVFDPQDQAFSALPLEGPFRSAVEGRVVAPTHDGTLAVVDAGRLGLEEVATHHTGFTLSVGSRNEGTLTGLTLRGDVSIERGIQFLKAVADGLEKPITLIL